MSEVRGQSPVLPLTGPPGKIPGSVQLAGLSIYGLVSLSWVNNLRNMTWQTTDTSTIGQSIHESSLFDDLNSLFCFHLK